MATMAEPQPPVTAPLTVLTDETRIADDDALVCSSTLLCVFPVRHLSERLSTHPSTMTHDRAFPPTAAPQTAPTYRIGPSAPRIS